MQNIIREHVFSVPDLISGSFDRIYQQCITATTNISFDTIQKIVLTGCGYSFASCISLKYYLEKKTNRPVIVLPGIDASRFTVPEVNDLPHTLIIGISNSGKVSRITEALMFYKKHGATCIAFTADMVSPICAKADCVVDTSTPSIGSSNPIRGYVACNLALIALGMIISGSSTDVAAREKAEIIRCAETLKEILPAIDTSFAKLASASHDRIGYEFIGAGYERAAAFLGKIEMLGQAGRMAIDEDPEQWLHCNFFMDNPENIGTMLFMSQGTPALSRCKEALSYMIHLGRPVVVVTDIPETDLPDGVQTIHLPVITPLSAGIVEMVAPSLFVGHLCEQTNIQYSRGFRGVWELFKDGCGTCESEIIVL